MSLKLLLPFTTRHWNLSATETLALQAALVEGDIGWLCVCGLQNIQSSPRSSLSILPLPLTTTTTCAFSIFFVLPDIHTYILGSTERAIFRISTQTHGHSWASSNPHTMRILACLFFNRCWFIVLAWVTVLSYSRTRPNITQFPDPKNPSINEF